MSFGGAWSWKHLGEELRVLYVAMTRAKEKLIMTGHGPQAPRQEAGQMEESGTERTDPIYGVDYSRGLSGLGTDDSTGGFGAF